MAKHVHMSLIMTFKSYHHCIRGSINNVVISIFIGTPRSHGPSLRKGGPFGGGEIVILQ
jgi:hypothetical protein